MTSIRRVREAAPDAVADAVPSPARRSAVTKRNVDLPLAEVRHNRRLPRGEPACPASLGSAPGIRSGPGGNGAGLRSGVRAAVAARPLGLCAGSGAAHHQCRDPAELHGRARLSSRRQRAGSKGVRPARALHRCGDAWCSALLRNLRKTPVRPNLRPDAQRRVDSWPPDQGLSPQPHIVNLEQSGGVRERSIEMSTKEQP